MPRPPQTVLVVLPSWIGDAVMATPALRALRSALDPVRIVALARPAPAALLAGLDSIDAFRTYDPAGPLAPIRAGRSARADRPAAALLFPNSFSSALAALLSGATVRIGYARDARSLLLTDRLDPPRLPDRSFAPVPAVRSYHRLAREAVIRLRPGSAPPGDPGPLELALTDRDRLDAERLLSDAPAHQPLALLNPGANNPAKRWPADRFAAVGRHLARRHHARVLVNGSPTEADLCADIAAQIGQGAIPLPARSPSLGALKGVIARCRIVITNDTGPRHIAAALRVPVVALFGPTDHRWTTIDAPAGEARLLADPSLPPDQVADRHPQRCRIDRIPVQAVIDAADRLLEQSAGHTVQK